MEEGLCVHVHGGGFNERQEKQYLLGQSQEHLLGSALSCLIGAKETSRPTQEFFRADQSTFPVEGTLLGSVKVSANGPSEEVPAVETCTNALSPMFLQCN